MFCFFNATEARGEPPEGLGFMLGLGSGWSRPTCMVEFDTHAPCTKIDR